MSSEQNGRTNGQTILLKEGKRKEIRLKNNIIKIKRSYGRKKIKTGRNKDKTNPGERGGFYKFGCLYINRLEDVDLKVLGGIIHASLSKK